MSKKINIIIVPDEGGKSIRFQASIFWLRTLAVGLAVFFIVVIIGGSSYTTIAKRALECSRLKTENIRLEKENQRIMRVTREVDQSRRILAQIIRSLGGHLDMGAPLDIDSTALDNALNGKELGWRDGDVSEENSFSLERVMVSSLPTLMPVDGFISQKFFQDHLFPERSHLGIDLAGKTGAVVNAATAGRVVFSGWTTNYGNCMMIYHSNGYLTFYGHNHVNLKSADEDVERGESIALLGNTGRSSAPHLHFEIWKEGVPVDPLELLQAGGKTT